MSRKKKQPNKWVKLAQLIVDYGEACRADEMKGGGDPLAIPEIEAHLELAKVRVERCIEEIRRDGETQ